MNPNGNSGGVSRRTFLRLSAGATLLAGAGAMLSSCAPATAPGGQAGTDAAPGAQEAITLRLVSNHGESDVPLLSLIHISEPTRPY